MICEKILGKLTDGVFSGKKVDYVDIHWDEAFKKLHRKTSQGGTELGIRLDDSVLTRGLNQDDVLAVEGDTVYAVNIPPCEVIVVTVDEHHPHMVARCATKSETVMHHCSGVRKRELSSHHITNRCG